MIRKRQRFLTVPTNEHGHRVRRMMARRNAWVVLVNDPPTDLKPGTLAAWRRHLARAEDDLTLAVSVLEAAGFELTEEWR